MPARPSKRPRKRGTKSAASAILTAIDDQPPEKHAFGFFFVPLGCRVVGFGELRGTVWRSADTEDGEQREWSRVTGAK
jgi:hypothetical protein